MDGELLREISVKLNALIGLALRGDDSLRSASQEASIRYLKACGLDSRNIAAILGTSHNTVQVALSKAARSVSGERRRAGGRSGR